MFGIASPTCPVCWRMLFIIGLLLLVESQFVSVGFGKGSTSFFSKVTCCFRSRSGFEGRLVSFEYYDWADTYTFSDTSTTHFRFRRCGLGHAS